MKMNKLLAAVLVAAFALPVMAQNAPAPASAPAATSAPAAAPAAKAHKKHKKHKKHHRAKKASNNLYKGA